VKTAEGRLLRCAPGAAFWKCTLTGPVLWRPLHLRYDSREFVKLRYADQANGRRRQLPCWSAASSVHIRKGEFDSYLLQPPRRWFGDFSSMWRTRKDCLSTHACPEIRSFCLRLGLRPGDNRVTVENTFTNVGEIVVITGHGVGCGLVYLARGLYFMIQNPATTCSPRVLRNAFQCRSPCCWVGGNPLWL